MSRLMSQARVLSLIVSDIVGDPVEMIASGPTVQVDINVNKPSNNPMKSVCRQKSIQKQL